MKASFKRIKKQILEQLAARRLEIMSWRDNAGGLTWAATSALSVNRDLIEMVRAGQIEEAAEFVDDLQRGSLSFALGAEAHLIGQAPFMLREAK